MFLTTISSKLEDSVFTAAGAVVMAVELERSSYCYGPVAEFLFVIFTEILSAHVQASRELYGTVTMATMGVI